MPKVPTRRQVTPGADPDHAVGDGGESAQPVKAGSTPRPPAVSPRLRFPPDASDATRAVLAHFHGPVYALDKRPHLAQHVAIAARDADPERVAALILDEVLGSLEHVSVKWTGAPAYRQWRRGQAPAPHIRAPRVEHVQLPKTFPCKNACVVWAGDVGLAGRNLCVEFALTEFADGRITGFSYRYDLIGTPYVLEIGDSPEPKPVAEVPTPELLGLFKPSEFEPAAPPLIRSESNLAPIGELLCDKSSDLRGPRGTTAQLVGTQPSGFVPTPPPGPFHPNPQRYVW